jgi:RNA polymerase sigma factor (sigma-70 family)
MSATERTDEELMAAYKGGETEALGELYQRYYRLFRKYAERVGGQESADILQTVFLKLIEQPELIWTTGAEFRRLVYIIIDTRTKNLLRDRNQRSKKEVSYDTFTREGSEPQIREELVPDAETRLMETEMFRHNQEIIQEVLMGLRFKRQQIIAAYMGGMTFKEAGEKNGVTKQRAQQVVHEFREKLAERIDFQLAAV